MSLLVLYVACKIRSCKVLAKHSHLRLSTCIVYLSFDFIFCFYFKCQFHYSSGIISRTLRPYILSHSHNLVSAHSYWNPWLNNCNKFFFKKVTLKLWFSYAWIIVWFSSESCSVILEDSWTYAFLYISLSIAEAVLALQRHYKVIF